jgi:hypothetical protein
LPIAVNHLALFLLERQALQGEERPDHVFSNPLGLGASLGPDAAVDIDIIGPRTPDSKGICCQALSAIGPMKLALSLTEKMNWETKESFEVVCPHGYVTFRLSRIR